MRQITKNEALKIKEKKLQPLIMGVFSDNLEYYVFPQLKLHWTKSNEETVESSVIVKDAEVYYLIQNAKHSANLYVLLPEINQQNIPEKNQIQKSINRLNIGDQIMWFNDWWYLPQQAKNLKQKILDWINEDKTIFEIKEKTAELTQFNDIEVKNLLTSHYLLIGTSQLENIYPD